MFRSIIISLLRTAVLFVVLCFASRGVQAQLPVYDATAQFDATHNGSSSSPWTYGSKTSLTGSFSLYTHSETLSNDFDIWYTNASYYPNIEKNLGGNRSFNDQGQDGYVPAGALTLSAGINGEYSTLRWKAPTTGSYKLDISFTGFYNNSVGTSADVHIIEGTTSLFDGTVLRNNTASSMQTVSLTEGDTLDFEVGYGSDHNARWDNLIISANITTLPTTVPEGNASSIVLLLATVGFLAMKMKK